MNRIILCVCISIGLFINASAQNLSKKEKKSLARIQNHVNYLASDRLEGRGTGSPGEKLSADYIAQQFKKNKVSPRGEKGDYYQTFEIITLRMAKDSTALFINALPLFLFQDFYPLSYSANRKIADAKMVRVGYGISAPELNYDDYSGKDVKGKIVVINISTPDSAATHSKFINYLSLETRVKKAESLGVSGIIFINTGNSKDNPSGEMAKNIKPSSIPVFFVIKPNLLFDPPEGLSLIMKANIFSIAATGHNVIAYQNNNAKYTVIIGAHHDHLGRGEIKGSREPQSNDIHNGADDNASGTSALIELSKLLKSKKYKKFNYLYIAFSGEEMGLIGSKYFVENPTIDLKNVTCMINMDMVGRLKETLLIYGTGTSPYWKEAIPILKQDSLAIHHIKTSESGIGSSDHTSFYLQGIPSLHFFTGQHDEYHKPSDDIGLLNLNGEVKVIQKIIQLVAITPSATKLEYTKTKDEDARMAFKITLGIMPDYVYDAEGVRVDGVKEGKPAAMAGLKKGDIIIGLAGDKIPNIEAYMKVLSKIEKGQKVEVIYIRNEKTLTAELQF
ncbi:MAG: M28 family peptidase [Bacteroidia bacterium]